jgi:hypothetical protein
MTTRRRNPNDKPDLIIPTRNVVASVTRGKTRTGTGFFEKRLPIFLAAAFD